MAEDDRTYSPSQAETNRARMQGGGVGQRDMDQQRDPDREQHATSPERTAPFDTDDEPRTFEEADDSRAPLLGEGVPANVDVRNLGEADTPQNDWGDPAGEGAVHGANHSARPERTEAQRGQGAKTRQMNKDIISRRT